MMATAEQVEAAKRNIKRAREVADEKHSATPEPTTRRALYEEARRRDLPGRSKMGRAELARALGRE